MQNTTQTAETGTAQASRLSTLTRYYIRSIDSDGKCRKHRLVEFETLAKAKNYLNECIRGNGVMAPEQPQRATFQIVKSVLEFEVLKTWYPRKW
jgi:hypothetical protein